ARTLNAAGLDLGYTAIDEELYARDVARFIGSEEGNGFGNLVRVSILPSGTAFANSSFILMSASPCCKLSMIGVSMWPGLITFTGMGGWGSWLVEVGAKERTAAFVAL